MKNAGKHQPAQLTSQSVTSRVCYRGLFAVFFLPPKRHEEEEGGVGEQDAEIYISSKQES